MENAGALQNFLQEYAASGADGTRPSVGKRVRIDEGKRKGAEGIVLRHIRDQFNPWKWRYKSDAQAMLQEICGAFGFRIQVETQTHGTFWIDADKVTVLT